MRQIAALVLVFSIARAIPALAGAQVNQARQGPGRVSLVPLTPSVSSTAMSVSLPGSILQTSHTSESPPASSTASPPASSVASPPASSVASPASSATPTMTTLTSNSPSPTSSSAPSPSFNTVMNMTTCTSANISWSYTGPSVDLSLSAVRMSPLDRLDALPAQPYRVGFSQKRQNPENVVVSLTNISASAQFWKWAAVDVSQGLYEIQGNFSGGQTTFSRTFFVTNGTDTSCITNSTSTTVSTSGVPTASSSAGSAAVSKSNTGAIAGGVVGGILGLIAIVALLLFLRSRRRPKNGGTGAVGRWGSLTSNDVKVKPARSARELATAHYHGHSESMGGILPSAGNGNSDPPSPGGSEADIASLREKIPSLSGNSPPSINPFDLIPPLSFNPRRESTSSLSSVGGIAKDARPRSSSVRASQNSFEQQAQRLRSSMDKPMYMRTERLSMPVLPALSLPRTPTSPRQSYDQNPAEMIPMGRSASNNGPGTRRTPRKPVPQYNPHELQDSSTSILDSRTPETQSIATGTGVSSLSHGPEVEPPRGVPELSHKSSFGNNQPVHYLIPDMPPPNLE